MNNELDIERITREAEMDRDDKIDAINKKEAADKARAEAAERARIKRLADEAAARAAADRRKRAENIGATIFVLFLLAITAAAIIFSIKAFPNREAVDVFKFAFAANLLVAVISVVSSIVHNNNCKYGLRNFAITMIFVSACMAAIMAFSGRLGVSEYVLDDNGFAYEKRGADMYLCDVDDSLTEFDISDLSIEIDGISKGTFKGNTSLKSVVIDGIELNIGKRAFAGCKNLKTVTLSNGSYTLGARSFANCKSLESVSFMEGTVEVKRAAFAGCSALERIDFVNNSSVILQAYCFAYNRSLRELNCSGGEYVIGTKAFMGCKKLNTVSLTNGSFDIGVKAFFKCKALINVKMDNADSFTLQASSFKKCTSLAEVEFGKGNYSIDDQSFDDCHALKRVFFNGGSYTFGSNVFLASADLKELYITDAKLSSNTIAIKSIIPVNSTELVVHNSCSDIEPALLNPSLGAKEPTFVLYNGTTSLGASHASTVVFAEGFDFSGWQADYATYGLKGIAQNIYIPTSVKHIPDYIFGSTTMKAINVYYQGSQSQWEYISIDAEEYNFLVPGGNSNISRGDTFCKIRYNSTSQYWDNN